MGAGDRVHWRPGSDGEGGEAAGDYGVEGLSRDSWLRCLSGNLVGAVLCLQRVGNESLVVPGKATLYVLADEVDEHCGDSP